MTTAPTKLRDDGLTLISIWHFLVGTFYLLVTVVLVLMTVIFASQIPGGGSDALAPALLFGVIALVFMALSLINVAVGYGLWTLRAWARTGALALSIVGLIFVPIGTLAGGLTLWYLLRPEAAALFAPH